MNIVARLEIPLREDHRKGGWQSDCNSVSKTLVSPFVLEKNEQELETGREC